MAAPRSFVDHVVQGTFRARRHERIALEERLPESPPPVLPAGARARWEIVVELQGRAMRATDPGEVRRVLRDLEVEAQKLSRADTVELEPPPDRAFLLAAAGGVVLSSTTTTALWTHHRAELEAHGYRGPEHIGQVMHYVWSAWRSEHGPAWRGRLSRVQARQHDPRLDHAMMQVDEREMGRPSRPLDLGRLVAAGDVPAPPFARIADEMTKGRAIGFSPAARAELLEPGIVERAGRAGVQVETLERAAGTA